MDLLSSVKCFYTILHENHYTGDVVIYLKCVYCPESARQLHFVTRLLVWCLGLWECRNSKGFCR